MAHEITSHDHLVIAGRPAWHGLGTVLPTCPDPDQALEAAKLKWEVLKKPLFFNDDTYGPIQAGGYVGLVRSDTGVTLGVASESYEPLQNRQVAELCWEIGRSIDPDLPVKVESAGSLRQGRDVFFLLKADDWILNGSDIVAPYLLMTTAHDGTRAFRIMDTSVRVVCKNTLTSALGTSRGFKMPHRKNIAVAATEAVRELAQAYKGLKSVELAYKYLAGASLSAAQTAQYAKDLYESKAGPRPTEFTKAERTWLDGQYDFVKDFEEAFTARDNVVRETFGTKLQLLNAATYMADHATVRYSPNGNHDTRSSAQTHRNLLGSSGPFKRKALQLALAL